MSAQAGPGGTSGGSDAEVQGEGADAAEKAGSGLGDGSERRPAIDRAYYDDSGYFELGADHLTDAHSRFQRYRVEKVRGIYDPGPDERVVDLGCGWGTFAFALAPRVREVVGVDFSARSVALCRERLALEPRENLRFVEADAAETGLEGASWDLVVAADLVEHLYPADSLRVVREAFRLLGPGGRLVVWTPNPGHVLEGLRRSGVLRADPTHVDYKSMARLRGLLEEVGFLVERAYFTESHVPGLRWLERLCLGWMPLLRRRIAVLARRPPEAAATPSSP